MPPVDLSGEEGAFTVLPPEGPPRVNVVRPLPRADMVAPAPHSVLDPKFSRALDFKLRRLKEKEILQANLRRPTRRARAAPLAASNPNLCTKAHNCVEGMSRSHPRIDVIAPDGEDSSPPRAMAEASPSPGRGSRRTRRNASPGGERPRFVTTVKVGQFLPPPPEVAELLGLESLYPAPERVVYSYASQPKAVAPRSKRALPERKDAPAPKRPHAGEVFSGVRALVASVAGLRHMLEQDTGSVAAAANLMHDKRVVRGSTFAAHPHAHGDGIESAAAKAARTRRRALARRAAAARLRPGTPPPAPGRRHHPIQTEYYLEELFDKGVEMEVGVQTDLFLDRPATPEYVPAKTGADAATQIYPGDVTVRLRRGGGADPGGASGEDSGAGAGGGGAGGGAGHAARAAAPLRRAARRRARRAPAPSCHGPADVRGEGAARGGGARGAGGGGGGPRAGRRRHAGAGLRGRAAALRAGRPSRPGIPAGACPQRSGRGVHAVAGARRVRGTRLRHHQPRRHLGDRARRGGGARGAVPRGGAGGGAARGARGVAHAALLARGGGGRTRSHRRRALTAVTQRAAASDHRLQIQRPLNTTNLLD